MGQQFRRRPTCFDEAHRWLGPWLGRWGHIEDRAEYLTLLRGADLVVSTALHDFQGLSVLEACALGCRPLVPDRLAYPEWFGPEHRYASHPGDAEREARALAEALERRLGARKQAAAPDVSWARWSRLRGKYERVLRGEEP